MGSDTDSREVSRILRAAESGQPADLSALLPLVYDHLRGIAARQMADERKDHTLEPTALVQGRAGSSRTILGARRTRMPCAPHAWQRS